ncbi:hypothetical protein SSX86_001063 [Deinandra increscens subsp. villosa]|uniref:Uncharacterized protein n=1 Tax=Deinandra increscens subsp. villosa TaxID=3103831 RepID=A0AAP0HC96_9ASTR
MEVEEANTTDSTVTNPSTTVAPPHSLSLIRNLASCNTPARSKALRELTNWLPTQLQISDDEMKKLWKGLFYCIWHADKAPVQSNLIDRLSSMLLTLDVPLSLHYLSVFFTTLRREWSGIDVLRLDKFYLLIRRFVNCSFRFLKRNSWNVELVQRVMNIYEEKSFLASDKMFLGNGVNYHIVSVYLDEIKTYLPLSPETYEILFKPLFNVMSVCQDRVMVSKIKSAVFEHLLCMGKSLLGKKKDGENETDDIDSEVLNLGTIALKMGFAAKFYELGSSSDCFQGNRKVLFGLNKEFVKLEKDLAASGIDIEFPTVEPDNGDEDVPDLVPIVADVKQKKVVSSGLLLEDSKSVVERSKKSSKKKKKKVAKEGSSSEKQESGKENDDGNMMITNGKSESNGMTSASDVTFTELFKSNLQKEFEKVAEEDGLDKDGESSLREDLSTITISSGKVPKKRKRAKSVESRKSHNPDITEEGGTALKSGEKSKKRVRFSKNNLVWKPQSPLPPQSLRIPPSVTPRGSALKKGVPAGPIREMPPAVKKAKKKKMKVRKMMKTTSPAMKRLRKLQTLSS